MSKRICLHKTQLPLTNTHTTRILLAGLVGALGVACTPSLEPAGKLDHAVAIVAGKCAGVDDASIISGDVTVAAGASLPSLKFA